MRTLLCRIQHLERLSLQRREAFEEMDHTNVHRLSEDQLWTYLAVCLGRRVAEVRSLTDQQLEQIEDTALRPTCESASVRTHAASGPHSEHPARTLTAHQAASELLRHRRARDKIRTYFPDTGPLRRELYPKHLEFFRAGREHSERLFLAGNRVGKTDAGAYETTLHLTGQYPDWWEGHRFTRAIQGWAAGDTHKTVREILQEKLLGPRGAYGTGMIPASALVGVTCKQGLAEAVDTIYVRHVSGEVSRLVLKSYEERRKAFQGAGLDWVWLDEEAPEEIYVECLMRLMVAGGLIILTFTPLLGLTPLVLRFLPSVTGQPAKRATR